MPKYVLLASVVAVVTVIGSSGLRSVQSAGPSTPAEISVTADGVVHAAPDTARLWIGVDVSGPTLAPADREADQRISAVIATLRSAGIPDAHLRTMSMTISPLYDAQNSQPQELRGYISGSMLEVETSDLPGLPGLIDSAMAAGANRVEQIRFESQNLEQLRGQARDQAWQAARARADQLAQRAGTRLDRVTSVDEPLVDETTTIQADRNPAYSGPTAATRSSVQAGEIEVRARLHVVWFSQ
jgi:uncharacterized protein